MPLVRGRAPTSRARLTPSNAAFGVVGSATPAQQREGAVVELHDDALERAERRRDLEQLELTGLSGPSSAPLAMRNSRL